MSRLLWWIIWSVVLNLEWGMSFWVVGSGQVHQRHAHQAEITDYLGHSCSLWYTRKELNILGLARDFTKAYMCISRKCSIPASKAECAAVSYGASLPWCAPEQILHEPCSSATDVYALGSVLWELCTGELPTRLRQFRPPKVPEEAPSEIAELFARCHSKDPQHRPTAAEAHAIILESRQSSEMTSVSVNHIVRS